MSPTLVEVTDLIEFLQRRESVSGVQRVIAETTPLLLDADPAATLIVLDRFRGVFVEMTPPEVADLFHQSPGVDPDDMARSATACLNRATGAVPVAISAETVVVFLGAVWINDALMMAAREIHTAGAKLVFLLYDLTPVLETGHTATVNRLFERYLNLVLQTASGVPSISRSSQADLCAYAKEHGYPEPIGSVTGLPCGVTPEKYDTSALPWPRPFALFVGTIEARKNHLLALVVWRQLIKERGESEVPDLVCIGRLGWHADEFLQEYVRTNGLNGKISLLTTSLSDAELAGFIAHAEFTIYPSRYEGWGLPVSESLAFGKLPVVARNSSLPEAGGDLAVYFTSGDRAAMVEAITVEALDLDRRSTHELMIRKEFTHLTWRHVADVLASDIAHARSTEGRKPVYPVIECGREYVLSTVGVAPDGGHADRYLRHLQTSELTPMLRQPRGSGDFTVVDAAVIGSFGSPQTWGYEIRTGRHANFRVMRPIDGDLRMLVSTRSMPGVVSIDVVGPGGSTIQEVYLGSVITLALGDGKAGEPAQVRLTVTDATDSIEGFLGICSFVVLPADDLQSRVIALQSMADALRRELDFVTSTRSWRITAPLRKLKGRGTR